MKNILAFAIGVLAVGNASAYTLELKGTLPSDVYTYHMGDLIDLKLTFSNTAGTQTSSGVYSWSNQAVGATQILVNGVVDKSFPFASAFRVSDPDYFGAGFGTPPPNYEDGINFVLENFGSAPAGDLSMLPTSLNLSEFYYRWVDMYFDYGSYEVKYDITEVDINAPQSSGSVPVPEPSTYGLVASLGLLGLAYIRRKLRRSEAS